MASKKTKKKSPAPKKRERPPYGGGRDALVIAAIAVVTARGLRGLTIRAVAEQAGVSHALIRWHFGSRDGLVEATLVRSVELAIETSDLEPETGDIDDMADDLTDWVEEEEELSAFQYECMVEARRKVELRPHVAEMYREFVDSTRRELERAGLGDDPDLARAVFALFDGLALQQTIFVSDADAVKRALAAAHEMIRALRDQRQGSNGAG